MTPRRAWRTTDVPPEYWEQAHLVGSIPFKAAASDPRASYCMYVPRQHYRHTAPKLPLIVNVHGNERHAERSRNCLVELVDRVGAAVLAPMFPTGIDDPNDTHNYKRLSNRGIRYDHILIDMLSEVGQRWPGIETGQILLVGFRAVGNSR
ncbi:hypothetical protein LTR46_000022 [Exophiala xenobiotica]|nr:hypothetical protein LTR46_000022 [Exophiala xenobiotica]